jgi:hypothetical protein
MPPFDAWTARSALNRIFWGTLICVLDFNLSQTVNGSGFQFDVISDVVGAAMIAWGVGQLRPLVADSAYVGIMSLCKIIAVGAILEALVNHVVMDWPLPVRLLSIAFSLACLLAIYHFCFAMQLFCRSLGLFEIEYRWRTSQTLFLWLLVVPALLVQSVGLLDMFGSKGWSLNLGPGAIIVVLAALVAVVHILLSIRRTRSGLFFAPPFDG